MFFQSWQNSVDVEDEACWCSWVLLTLTNPTHGGIPSPLCWHQSWETALHIVNECEKRFCIICATLLCHPHQQSASDCLIRHVHWSLPPLPPQHLWCTMLWFSLFPQCPHAFLLHVFPLPPPSPKSSLTTSYPCSGYANTNMQRPDHSIISHQGTCSVSINLRVSVSVS